jgi:two-component system, NtrC family, sensor kinase
LRNNSKKEALAIEKTDTRRNKTAQRLKDSELKYRRLFEAAQDGILILNGDTGHIIDANPFVTDLLGYARKELLGKQLWEIGAFKDIDASKIAYMELQQKNYIRYNCLPLETKDKRLIDVEFVSNAYQVDGSRIIQCNIRDVTEYMKLDLLLRQKSEQSEEKHRILFETMAQGVVYQDTNGKIIEANPAAERILGLTNDQMIGRTSLDVRWSMIHEDGTEFPCKTHPAMVALQTGKPVMNTVMGFFHPYEESYNWILVNAIPQFKPEADRPYQVYTTFTDITQLKQSEAALRESDERYQALLDRSNDLVYIHDFKGNFIEVNVAALTLLGYKKEEIIGRNFTSILNQDQFSSFFEVLREIKKTGTQKESSEYRLKCKNGDYIYVETKETAIYRNGEPYAMLGIGRDITERKQSEEALRASEEKLRLIFDSVTDGITITDLEGIVVDLNKAVVQLHKYNTKEQLIGKNYLELIAAEDRHQACENMKKIMEESRGDVIECKLLAKNGRRFAAKLSAALIRDQVGNPLGFILITKDITERKRIEAQKKLMEQKAQLNSHMAAIGEMASGIGHEINNPLTGVIGYAQLLLKMDVSDDMMEAFEVINDGSQRVADIVKRLLTFARKQKPDREYVNINEILENTIILRRYSLETNNIKVITHLDPDLPITAADSGQLQQVFLNLIINAEWEMKHANGKGKLIITTEHPDDIIRISIKDDGPGISNENMVSIFKPFFTTKEAGEGTGLGLSICHEIISEHSGKMYVDNQLEKGASFFIELPILSKVEQVPQVTENTQKRVPIVRAKILVIDDEASIGTFLKQVLIKEGHEVETIENAHKALAKIKNEEYDLILMDIRMPGMSGIKLYHHIKKIKPVLSERILFITGDIMGAETGDFLKSTKARYIKKPFDINNLMEEINGVLSRD